MERPEVITLIASVMVLAVSAMVEEMPLPPDLLSCFESHYMNPKVSTINSEKINFFCTQKYVFKQIEHRALNLSEEAKDWVRGLFVLPKKRNKRQSLRIRREYRRLTDQERQQFHNAILQLKRDTSISPNRYDILVTFHRILGDRAHYGPAFLGWHRVFIMMFENALRQKNPSVTLPYWDSTMDEPMSNPSQSVIWGSRFMGNGNGVVRMGPFAFWQTPVGPLIRSVGTRGNTFRLRDILRVLTRTRSAQISQPTAENTPYDFEDLHGDVHRFIGGQMAPLDTSPHDPVFYLHHAYIDYVWEIFRRNQRRRGIDPSTDYPVSRDPLHAPQSPIGLLALRNIDGYSNEFTSQVYTYEVHPTCTRQSQTCNSQYLFCATQFNPPRCVSRSFLESPLFGRKRRSSLKQGFSGNNTMIPNTAMETMMASDIHLPDEYSCKGGNIQHQSLNTFGIDGHSGIDHWVFLPIKVTVSITLQADLLKYPYSFQSLWQRNKCPLSGAGKISLESHGLNYNGKYEDYVITQDKMPLSENIVYIATKAPDDNGTEVLISVYDRCDRLCRPFCMIHNTEPPEIRPCSGAVKITSQLPKLYARNIRDAIELAWDCQPNEEFPRLNKNNIFLHFHCTSEDYRPTDFTRFSV